ncbi:hypothetical protein OGAPHI_001250 [Ogataea philodendri]|uniref:Uncharacterized protein n=1 Tax=Ogataea philodendri TaxID=1378263 RepID=A0A9P8PFR9_9ASCO|nr:uncharacterized protein OGAPHI_001250 [Ogataea philodendri]KAH3670735.1 hypothetical protein OGAPHI_001250 [Ogataea philodendri]
MTVFSSLRVCALIWWVDESELRISSAVCMILMETPPSKNCSSGIKSSNRSCNTPKEPNTWLGVLFVSVTMSYRLDSNDGHSSG